MDEQLAELHADELHGVGEVGEVAGDVSGVGAAGFVPVSDDDDLRPGEPGGVTVQPFPGTAGVAGGGGFAGFLL